MTNKIRGWNLRLLGNAWWKKCGHETTSAFSVLIVIPACLYCVCIVSVHVRLGAYVVCVHECACACVSPFQKDTYGISMRGKYYKRN